MPAVNAGTNDPGIIIRVYCKNKKEDAITNAIAVRVRGKVFKPV
jgi:hypothetical protein